MERNVENPTIKVLVGRKENEGWVDQLVEKYVHNLQELKTLAALPTNFQK